MNAKNRLKRLNAMGRSAGIMAIAPFGFGHESFQPRRFSSIRFQSSLRCSSDNYTLHELAAMGHVDELSRRLTKVTNGETKNHQPDREKQVFRLLLS